MFRKNLYALFATFMLTSCVSHGTKSDVKVMTTLVQVKSVKVIFLQSFPVRVQIIVHGQKVKDVDLDVKQERKGNEVTVTITQTYSERIQPRVWPFKEHVFLKGGFPPGTYFLRVNDYSMTFEVK